MSPYFSNILCSELKWSARQIQVFRICRPRWPFAQNDDDDDDDEKQDPKSSCKYSSDIQTNDTHDIPST